MRKLNEFLRDTELLGVAETWIEYSSMLMTRKQAALLHSKGCHFIWKHHYHNHYHNCQCWRGMHCKADEFKFEDSVCTKLRWGGVHAKQSTGHHDNFERFAFQGVSNLCSRFDHQHQCCGRGGGAREINRNVQLLS